MEVRPFEQADRDACLAIFDSVATGTAGAATRPDFVTFLESPSGPYFVLENDGRVVGCGGYKISTSGSEATLVWGMIGREFQRMGLGRFLLLYRIREIGKAGNIQLVRVQTSPLSSPFFERQGFRVSSITPNRVELIKKLTVCP